MPDVFRCKEGNKVKTLFRPACATFSRRHDTAARYNFRQRSAIPQSNIVKNNTLQLQSQW